MKWSDFIYLFITLNSIWNWFWIPRNFFFILDSIIYRDLNMIPAIYLTVSCVININNSRGRARAEEMKYERVRSCCVHSEIPTKPCDKQADKATEINKSKLTKGKKMGLKHKTNVSFRRNGRKTIWPKFKCYVVQHTHKQWPMNRFFNTPVSDDGKNEHAH